MKKLMKILPVILVAVFVMTNVFAVNADNLDATLQGGTPNTTITGLAGDIWQTIATIVQIVAVAAVVFAGLRYMFASADQKADIKKSMGILVVGAILVFAATTLIKWVAGVAKETLTI